MERGFPELIRYWREDEGLSLSKAAAKVGITKAHLWELEDGRAVNPTIKTLAGLARAYGTSVSYLAHLAAQGLPDSKLEQPKPLSSDRASIYNLDEG
jgi:transcriptional regulator with XRE-family HTH domain